MSFLFALVAWSLVQGLGQGLLTRRPFAAAAALAMFPFSILVMDGRGALLGVLACLAAVLAGASLAHAILRRRGAGELATDPWCRSLLAFGLALIAVTLSTQMLRMGDTIAIVADFFFMSLGLGLIGRRPLLSALLGALVPLWLMFAMPYISWTIPITCMLTILATLAGAVCAHLLLWLRRELGYGAVQTSLSVGPRHRFALNAKACRSGDSLRND